jgi:hypothetical protein
MLRLFFLKGLNIYSSILSKIDLYDYTVDCSKKERQLEFLWIGKS